MDGPLHDRGVREFACRTRLSHVAVSTALGPHVTPEVFAVAGGRLWIVTSSNSVKVRSIRASSRVGVLVRSGSTSLALCGSARVLSPWFAREALGLLTPSLPEAAVRYGLRNVPTLLGYAMDACMLPAGWLPIDRVFVVITPESGAFIESGEVVREWGDRSSVTSRAAPLPPLAPRNGLPDLPEHVAALMERDGNAAAAVSTPGGPVIVPGEWDPRRRAVRTSAGICDTLGLPPAGAGCIELDESWSFRPTQLRGVIVRGDARVTRTGADAWVSVNARRLTWWDGFETGSAKIESHQRRRAGHAG